MRRRRGGVTCTKVQTSASPNCGQSGPIPQVADGTVSVFLPCSEEVSIHSVTAAQR